MLNIIDSDLGEKIKRIVKEKDMAIVLSSLNETVHGYYSTNKQKSLTRIGQIRYNNQDFAPVLIARMMGEKDYSDKLEQEGLTPFCTFNSEYKNKQGLEFRLIVVGDIEFDKVQNITDLLEERWKKNTKYSMNLGLDKQLE